MAFSNGWALRCRSKRPSTQSLSSLGGTHFIVLRSTRETRPGLGIWITPLTVDVLRVPGAA
jgi:hypothetical protein